MSAVLSVAVGIPVILLVWASLLVWIHNRHKHVWKTIDVRDVTNFDEDLKERVIIGQKFVQQCEPCGKLKVFRS
jgi:hypothetical protein